jgi:hypothetical protein
MELIGIALASFFAIAALVSRYAPTRHGDDPAPV